MTFKCCCRLMSLRSCILAFLHSCVLVIACCCAVVFRVSVAAIRLFLIRLLIVLLLLSVLLLLFLRKDLYAREPKGKQRGGLCLASGERGMCMGQIPWVRLAGRPADSWNTLTLQICNQRCAAESQSTGLGSLPHFVWDCLGQPGPFLHWRCICDSQEVSGDVCNAMSAFIVGRFPEYIDTAYLQSTLQNRNQRGWVPFPTGA
jgi:hypothetical protein